MQCRRLDEEVGFRARRADEGAGFVMNQRNRTRVTISGSFQRFISEVEEAREKFAALGASVLSPPSGFADSKHRGFTRLQGDPSKSVRLTEDRHLEAIQHSDFLWIISPDGDVGLSTTLEIGCAVAAGVPVFGTRPIKDETVKNYVQVVNKPEQAMARAAATTNRSDTTLLLDPPTAIAAIRQELNELEGLLTWEDGPMTARNSRKAREAATKIKTILAVLGTLARDEVTQ